MSSVSFKEESSISSRKVCEIGVSMLSISHTVRDICFQKGNTSSQNICIHDIKRLSGHRSQRHVNMTTFMLRCICNLLIGLTHVIFFLCRWMSPGSTWTVWQTRVPAAEEVTASVSARVWQRTLSAAATRVFPWTGARPLCAVSQNQTASLWNTGVCQSPFSEELNLTTLETLINHYLLKYLSPLSWSSL